MKRTLAALLTLAALALTGAATAQNPGEASVSGVVVATTSDSLVIRMDDGSQRTFVTDFTTTLPSDRLLEGNRVTVRYSPLEGGRWQAISVTSTTATTPDPSPRALPDTASEMPLVGVVGAAALAGAVALTALRRAL